MGLMRGRAPIRRTMEYLKQGKLFLKPNLKIMLSNVIPNHPASSGLQEFIFWHLPQLQYKNQEVQFLTFRCISPTPYIQFINMHGESIAMDCYGQNKEDVYEKFFKTFCYTDLDLITKIRDQQMYGSDLKNNRPENFGPKFRRNCICLVDGQVPCPAFETLPKELRGKYTPLNTRNKWRKIEEALLQKGQETEVPSDDDILVTTGPNFTRLLWMVLTSPNLNGCRLKAVH
eukprot:XP_011450654.2 PREDICTED: 28S ribosomal protein S25, mitochondrial-like [Crassostrea gigas]